MEYLDIVDENGTPTGETVERKKAHKEGIWHRTAHVWIARRKNDKVQLLLQKRCIEKESYPGCYDISSAGHIPAGSECIESAMRELEEELGVTNVSEEELIYCGDRRVILDNHFHGQEYHDRQYTKVFLLWLDRDADTFTVQPEEIESVMWMDFTECLEGVTNNSFTNCIDLEELDMLSQHI